MPPVQPSNLYTEREPCGNISGKPHADCSGYIHQAQVFQGAGVNYATGFRRGDLDPAAPGSKSRVQATFSRDFQDNLNRTMDLWMQLAIVRDRGPELTPPPPPPAAGPPPQSGPPEPSGAHDTPDAPDDNPTPDTDQDQDQNQDQAPGIPPEVRARIDEVLADHPDVADAVAKLVQDNDRHPLNVNKDILDPARRERALELLRELADGQVLRDRDLRTYLRECPGHGLVFEGIPDDVNVTEDGTSRKQAFVDESKELDPARAIGMDPTEEQQHLLDEYAAKLIEVETEVADELRAICPDGASFSVRSKDADAVLDKVMRMSQGSPGRPGRPNYRVGDVIDAVGGRITVENMDQLEQALRNVQQRFGTGDSGRILEIENMYAEPKSKNPEYRVIPMVVRIDVDGEAFTFELQLTTRRASVAADVEHNTLFKPYHELSDEQREHIKRMQSEAAALDQEETRQ